MLFVKGEKIREEFELGRRGGGGNEKRERRKEGKEDNGEKMKMHGGKNHLILFIKIKN